MIKSYGGFFVLGCAWSFLSMATGCSSAPVQTATATTPSAQRFIASQNGPAQFDYQASCQLSHLSGRLAGPDGKGEIQGTHGLYATMGCFAETEFFPADENPDNRPDHCSFEEYFMLKTSASQRAYALRINDKRSLTSLLLKGPIREAGYGESKLVAAFAPNTDDESFGGERFYTDEGPSVLKQAVSRFHGKLQVTDVAQRAVALRGDVVCTVNRVVRLNALPASQFIAKPCVPDIDQACGSDAFTPGSQPPRGN